MKFSKLLKLGIFLLVVVFFCTYFIEKTGYYDYKMYNKKIITEREMERFEEDVKNGLDVDIYDYLGNTNIDYSNNLTKTTSNISLKLNKYIKNVLVNGFDIFEVLFK